LAIGHLGFGPKRFAEIRRLRVGISQEVLTWQLRQRETDGSVHRKVRRAASPSQVTCSLTRAATELRDPMSILCIWGTRHLGIPPNLPRYPPAPRTISAMGRSSCANGQSPV
jgi:DNA-binding HxlR family transcriptional regulator